MKVIKGFTFVDMMIWYVFKKHVEHNPEASPDSLTFNHSFERWGMTIKKRKLWQNLEDADVAAIDEEKEKQDISIMQEEEELDYNHLNPKYLIVT